MRVRRDCRYTAIEYQDWKMNGGEESSVEMAQWLYTADEERKQISPLVDGAGNLAAVSVSLRSAVRPDKAGVCVVRGACSMPLLAPVVAAAPPRSMQLRGGFG